MNAEQVRALIDEEILNGLDPNDSSQNPHRVDLNRSLLVRPERHPYLDTLNGDRPIGLWLLLEEDPDEHQGYKIVFDEARGEFGLAFEHYFLGYYGSFSETLANM